MQRLKPLIPTLYIVFLMLPIYWLLSMSFKTTNEILGGFIWNYQLWTHRQPVRVYRNGQREPLDVYQRLVNANYNLNVTRRALIHDFPEEYKIYAIKDF